MTNATATATLTRLRLNPHHHGATADLANAHRMHRRLMSLFPDDLGDKAREQAGLLYRVEHDRHHVTILAQSVMRPDTTRLPDDYATVDTTDLDPLLDLLDHDTPVRYRIDANAVAIKTTDNHKARRWLHGDEALAWWQRRATAAGLTLVSAALVRETLTYASSTPKKRGTPHGTSRFEGLATVTDPDAVRHATLNGIGRARSYGCGLLSLAPADDR
ncbi:type I-E CRISPR-associated protein Cas6/Cse3/CasE [Saccharothrix obliqua]|uniref:type I-E CRISPR-associated protein Cas6/Cse3/CasE n=1 Tax=Saccharothrix obliqua TaxID=2861747 RepID=UPI001C5CF4BE|nr:type I-E CRISPR-associated protein Cas6/Cse3/CasE [Saccharothrix obliqua]MBW4717333.1 type I-E CRISPR-associated protein Cas6/Cse3/CasE [Saccharothrix obliqua]